MKMLILNQVTAQALQVQAQQIQVQQAQAIQGRGQQGGGQPGQPQQGQPGQAPVIIRTGAFVGNAIGHPINGVYTFQGTIGNIPTILQPMDLLSSNRILNQIQDSDAIGIDYILTNNNVAAANNPNNNVVSFFSL